ncbi:MAG TPA: 30S ribosome-binding factor RbfA [Gammaproteobacteria bacterium]
MPRDYPRKLRVAAELQRALNSLLATEVKDPRLDEITVSEVEVSGDLSVARIRFSTLDPDSDPAPVLEGLSKAGGFLRSRVGQILGLRRTPELRFEHDESARAGIEIGALIDAAVARDRGSDSSGGNGSD